MIEFNKVSYTYFSKFYTLFEFSYKFNDGNYALISDNVSGGLTLIRLLAKLDTFYKGEILINGKSLRKTNYKKDFSVAYISATPKFFNNKSILYNVCYPLKARSIKKQERITIALNTLSKFGWQNKANQKVASLTYDELITLSLIRASVRKLDLLLCENIFATHSPSILSQISATTKIIVAPIDLKLDNYTYLYFNLGSLDKSYTDKSN